MGLSGKQLGPQFILQLLELVAQGRQPKQLLGRGRDLPFLSHEREILQLPNSSVCSLFHISFSIFLI